MRLVAAIACALAVAGCFVKPDHGGGDAGSGSGNGPVAYSAVFAAVFDQISPPNPFTFSGQATDAGNLILFHIACAGTQQVGTWTLDAPGWTVSEVGLPRQSSVASAALFAAFAPSTEPTIFAVTFPTACGDVIVLADELRGVAPSFAAVFDDTQTTSGTGNCMTTLTSHHDGDMLWGACTSGTSQIVVAPFLPGANDGHGDIAGYLPEVSAGATSRVEFVDPAGGTASFVLTAVSVVPR